MRKSTQVLVSVLALSSVLVAGCSQNESGVNSSSPNAILSPDVTVPADNAKNDELRVYQVTIMNLSSGQPLSPPVVATHSKDITMFEVGKMASRGLEAIAENGDESLMFNRFVNSPLSTDAVDVGMPLTRYGTTVGNFKHYATFEITATKHDRLSLAAMLICSNDGFTGLNSVKLPKKGKKTYYLKGYDAGTEYNTEMSSDIVDGCSALGAIALAGDPNGNENNAVDSNPHMPIKKHGMTQGNGDLDPELHVIEKKVGKVVIELIPGGDNNNDHDDDDDDDDHDNDDD